MQIIQVKVAVEVEFKTAIIATNHYSASLSTIENEILIFGGRKMNSRIAVH